MNLLVSYQFHWTKLNYEKLRNWVTDEEQDKPYIAVKLTVPPDRQGTILSREFDAPASMDCQN
jgi:hypothetical protein